MSKSIECLTVIRNKNSLYGDQLFFVVDREPEYVYQRFNDYILGEDGGCHYAYQHHRDPYAKAFGGREFILKLRDGTEVKCSGEWWACSHPARGINWRQVAIGSPDSLKRCFVFCSALVDEVTYERWLKAPEWPGTYFEYEKKLKDEK